VEKGTGGPSDSVQSIDGGPKEDDSGDSDANNTGSATAKAMAESVMLDRREQEKYSRAKSPFMGLLASRVSCVDCGYTVKRPPFGTISVERRCMKLLYDINYALCHHRPRSDIRHLITYR